MVNLQMMRAFNEVSEEFLSENMSLGTVSRLTEVIRFYRKKLSSDQIKDLLEIPLNVLENDVVLSNEQEFQRNGNYFIGNIKPLLIENESLQYFVDQIRSNSFSLKGIAAYVKHIQDNPSLQQNDYLLRIPEVTLRDFSNLSPFNNFYRSGRVFANMIDRIIGI